MTILLIGNHGGVFPTEISRRLRALGYDVAHVDFVTLAVERETGTETAYADALKRSLLPARLKSLARLRLLRKMLASAGEDIVHFHFARWFYFLLAPTLRHLPRPSAVTVYGSDFYRIGPCRRWLQRRFFRAVDAVTFTNEATMAVLIRSDKTLAPKCALTRFGLTPLEAIDRYRGTPRAQMRDALGLPTLPVTVCCGYNASPGQQHMKMIEALGRLPERVRSETLFVFPMGYGGSDAYKEQVKAALGRSGLTYAVPEAFLRDEKIAYLRLLPDVMVNMLVTDQFSGSMQEHLYAGNRVIAGSWLPYETFEAHGVRMMRADSFEALPGLVEAAVKGPEVSETFAQNNARVIAALSSWSAAIGAWTALYERLGKERT